MPKGSVIMALISVLIGSGYFLALMFMKAVMYATLWQSHFILLATVLGTYLLFMFFTVFVLKRARNNKSSFYNGMNMVTTSQLLYRIKGNAKSLATISILSAVTLTAVGTSVTILQHIYTIKSSYAIQLFLREKDAELDKKVNAIFAEEKKDHPIKDQVEIETVPVKGKFEGDKVNFILNMNYTISEKYQFMSQSEFNKLAKN